MLKKDLERLKKRLPKGATQMIEKQVDCGLRNVQMILSGKNVDNHGVIEIAKALADAEEIRRKNLAKKISKSILKKIG
jgi:phage terminase small subunit